LEILKGRNCFQDLGVDERIILKCILNGCNNLVVDRGK
jgi:hypothetical protein